MIDNLIFQTHPTFTLASNTFINCEVVLQSNGVPLIELVKSVDAGQNATYATGISIYHEDGTFLAKAKGGQLYPTKDGEKAGIVMRYPDKMTVCELAGQTLFEIRREEAAALKGVAELYAPGGVFVKATQSEITGKILARVDGPHLEIGGMLMKNSTINARVGISIDADGRVGVGGG